MIGDVDVKTKNIHFYVQRSTNFDVDNAVIPWEVTRLNEGGAMNIASGIFTVPVPGIYHFEFSGMKLNSAPFICVFLQVNGATIGTAGSNASGQPAGTYESYSLTASLRLKAGDTVSLYNSNDGILYEAAVVNYKNQFAGWLVEEDLQPVV